MPPPVPSDMKLNIFRFYWGLYQELVVVISFGVCYLWCILATFGKGNNVIEKTLKEIIKDNKK